MFGVCPGHEQEGINRHFAKSLGRGVVEIAAPLCFKGHVEWKHYVVAATLSVPHKSRAETDHAARRMDYCKDCTIKFKQEMMKNDTCSHPETVFILSDIHAGDLTGVSITHEGRTAPWEKAVMGMSGPVVMLPSADVINEQLTIISTPKKRGPKPKKHNV